jgi:SAM-dependent methyltransferase
VPASTGSLPRRSFVGRTVKRIVPTPVRNQLKTLRRTIQATRNHGTDVNCPCCGGSFKRFLPYGRIVQRPAARCPQCGAMERHRLIWLYINRETNLLRDPLRVMHSAPEVAFRDKLASAANLDYLTADLEPGRADLAADLMKMPIPSDSFDVEICNHVLEHVPDDRQAMSELFRMLKPGGWAIITVPMDLNRQATFEDPSVTSPEDRLEVFGQEDHLRIYGMDFSDRLKSAGFVVKELWYRDQLPADEQRVHGLNDGAPIYRCSKPVA